MCILRRDVYRFATGRLRAVPYWWHSYAVYSSYADEYFKQFHDRIAMVGPGVSLLIQDELFVDSPAEVVAVSAITERTVLPVKRDTKSKGDISELRVAVELTRIDIPYRSPWAKISAMI